MFQNINYKSLHVTSLASCIRPGPSPTTTTVGKTTSHILKSTEVTWQFQLRHFVKSERFESTMAGCGCGDSCRCEADSGAMNNDSPNRRLILTGVNSEPWQPLRLSQSYLLR